MLHDLIDTIQTGVDTLPLALQVIALFAIGLVPILEGDVAAGVGVVAGVPLVLALVASAAGTIVVTVGAVATGARLGDRRRKGERERKILARVERWGIPIAMLIGGFFISVSINAFVMSAAGLNRRVVLASGVVVAVINAVFVGLIAAGVLELVM